MSKDNLVNAFNILLRNGQEADEEALSIVEKRVVGYTKDLEDGKTKTNKGKDMQKTTLDTHFNNFTQWSTDRKIIQNGNVLAQGLKLVSVSYTHLTLPTIYSV